MLADLATLPSLILVLLNLGSFLELMRTAGGLIALGIAFMVPAAYRRCRRENGQLLLPKALGSTPLQVVVFLAFILMAVGSMIRASSGRSHPSRQTRTGAFP